MHTTQLGDISQQAGALAEATEDSSSFSSLDFTIATTIITSLADSALATNQLEVCSQEDVPYKSRIQTFSCYIQFHAQTSRFLLL